VLFLNPYTAHEKIPLIIYANDGTWSHVGTGKYFNHQHRLLQCMYGLGNRNGNVWHSAV
jgi:hypothetical protein